MKVLEAIEKLEEINREIEALDIGISKIDSGRGFVSQVEILEKMKRERIKAVESLKSQLEKTSLVTMR